MITRSLPPSRPIPFADPLHQGAATAMRDSGWMPFLPATLPHAPAPAPRPALGSSWMPQPLEGRGRPMASEQDGAAGRPISPPAMPASTAGAPARVAGPSAQASQRALHVPAEALPRRATARYDGPHSLSVRSSTTGRHYRFPQQGTTQVIDAADIALMRRIEDITLL